MGKLVWVGQVVVGQCGVDGRAMKGVGASCRVGKGKLRGGKGYSKAMQVLAKQSTMHDVSCIVVGLGRGFAGFLLAGAEI